MKIKLKTIEAFEAIGPTGTVTKLQQVGPEWNGMIELQTPEGLKLVLMRDGQRGLNLLSMITGNDVTDWSVIAGSVTLLGQLGLRAGLDKAVLDVIETRRQQILKGHDPSHDDCHIEGELAIAASCLLLNDTDCRLVHSGDHLRDMWGLCAKHPDRREQLVIATALALAELQRFDRREAWKRNQPRPAQDAAGNPEGGSHG